MICEVEGCGAKINYDGALLYSPPDKDKKCRKIHICKECYEETIKLLEIKL